MRRKRDGRWQAMAAKEQEEYHPPQVDEHSRPEQIGKMATRAGVKTVVLSHLGHVRAPMTIRTWAEEVKKHFSGQVHVAKDLAEF